jgi:hypothetical protein
MIGIKCHYPSCFESHSNVKYIDNVTYCYAHAQKLERAKMPLKDYLVDIQRGHRKFLVN